MAYTAMHTRLGTIAHVIMGQAPLGSTYNEQMKGLPLIAGAGDLGDTFPRPSRWTTRPTQICQSGDIIFCIRATIGIMNWADKEYCLGRGVAAIRVNNSLVEAEYLYYWLVANVNELLKVASGSTFIQVRRQDIEDLSLLLPPRPEQRRIVAILRKADEIRRLRQQANERMQEITKALFYDMFGDPIENDRKWKTARVKDICDLVRGSSPRPQGDPRYFGGPIPRLMVADITRDGSYVTPRIDSLTEEGAKASRLMNARAVVMAVSGSPGGPGLPAILTVDACIHDGIVGFRNLSKLLTPEFFLGLLLAMKEKNTVQAVGATFHNLTTDQINNWSILLPPIRLQEQYAALVSEIRIIGTTGDREAYSQISTLYQALLAQSFSGELTASWRAVHAQELAQATQERDKLLQNLRRATKPITAVQPIQIESQIDNREELIAELSIIQNVLLKLIDKKRETYFIATKLQDDIQTCFNDQGEYLADLDEEGLYKDFEGLDYSLDTLRRALHFLAMMGLIKELTLPVEEGSGTGVFHYITVYRYLQSDDNCQELDLRDLDSNVAQGVLA